MSIWIAVTKICARNTQFVSTDHGKKYTWSTITHKIFLCMQILKGMKNIKRLQLEKISPALRHLLM